MKTVANPDDTYTHTVTADDAGAMIRMVITHASHLRLWRFESEPEPRVNAVTQRQSPIRRLGPRVRPKRKR